MIKKAIVGSLAVALVAGLLLGRDVFSYVSTSYNRVTNAVQETVPVEFQIDRARQMVEDLHPEIRHSMHVIAKEEVELEKLNGQIVAAQAKASQDKSEILRLQADLSDNRSVYSYAGRSYSVGDVKTDLSRRFSRFKVADDTIASLMDMRDARQRNLDAAQEKLTAMISARQKLRVDIENLEAKRMLVNVAQASSDYAFDDSQLARAKELITDIRTRLDVAAKLANADVTLDAEIRLDDDTPADISDQVAEYFGIGEITTARYVPGE